MNKFMNFINSNEAKSIRSFSPFILLLLFFIMPMINMIKIRWLIPIIAPIEFFILIGFNVYSIKQYKKYINQINQSNREVN